MIQKQELPFGRPYIDEKEKDAANEVLGGHILTHGPKCLEFETLFEKHIAGGKAVTTSSCMASLHISAICLGFRKGDEILVPAQTHVATVHAIELVGAKPVFIDCELETGNIDLELIEEHITKKTRGIVIVHFAGIPVKMDRVIEIADNFRLKVIEDCALALGSKYQGKHVGLWGDTGCFSFYPVKHITTGEGGMLTSKNEETAQKIARFRAFNVDRNHSERTTPGVYDVIGVGLNYRMSEIQAAIGVVQMQKLEEILSLRKKNFLALKNGLKKFSSLAMLDSKNIDAENSYYAGILLLKEGLRNKRDELVNYLKARRIGFSIYYPNPVPRMSYYQEKYATNEKIYKNASIVSDCSIALPVGPHLNNIDMNFIVEEVSNFATKNQ